MGEITWTIFSLMKNEYCWIYWAWCSYNKEGGNGGSSLDARRQFQNGVYFPLKWKINSNNKNPLLSLSILWYPILDIWDVSAANLKFFTNVFHYWFLLYCILYIYNIFIIYLLQSFSNCWTLLCLPFFEYYYKQCHNEKLLPQCLLFL